MRIGNGVDLGDCFHELDILKYHDDGGCAEGGAGV